MSVSMKKCIFLDKLRDYQPLKQGLSQVNFAIVILKKKQYPYFLPNATHKLHYACKLLRHRNSS